MPETSPTEKAEPTPNNETPRDYLINVSGEDDGWIYADDYEYIIGQENSVIGIAFRTDEFSQVSFCNSISVRTEMPGVKLKLPGSAAPPRELGGMFH